MSKFLYWQDGHISGNNPISRKGDFFNDWLIKFDELLNIAKENKVEAILDGGDLLHSPNPSYRVLDEIADRVEANGVPMYSLFGNHSELYHSVERSQYTGLAHLQKRSKLFKYFDHIFTDEYSIGAIEYHHNIEEDLKEKGIDGLNINFWHDCKGWKIAVVHAFICPKVFPYAVHVVCNDIKTNADVVLVAHYHSVWQKKVGHTQYIDIGCFGRRSITEHNIVPSCILLDTEKRSYEIIPLKSAKPANEVFDLEKKEELKKFENKIQSFVEELKDISTQGINLKDVIKSLGKANNVDKEIQELMLKYIHEIELEESK